MRLADSDAGSSPRSCRVCKRVHGGRPRFPLFTAGVRRGQAGATVPEAVGVLECEKCARPSPRAPPWARSVATSCGGAWVRSRSTCHRIVGSPSSNQFDHVHRRTVSLAAGRETRSLGGHETRDRADSMVPAQRLGQPRRVVAYGPAVGWAVVRRRPPPRGRPLHGPFVSSHRAEGPCPRSGRSPLAALARHHPVGLVYLATCAVLTCETPCQHERETRGYRVALRDPGLRAVEEAVRRAIRRRAAAHTAATILFNGTPSPYV